MIRKILQNQATLNIGVIGHVAHGKSTIVHAITGIQTVKFKKELERNITIKLGYANSKFFKCTNYHCPAPGCFRSVGSESTNRLFCEQCHYDMKLIKHVSFIDCPGHEILMSTMLCGASIMDTALLVIAANEFCPQPQTAEHLVAVEVLKMKKLIVVQNKVDIVSKTDALNNYRKIKNFLKETSVRKSIIIPISAQRRWNIDVLVQMIIQTIPSPIRNYHLKLRLFLVRSFDVNKPGCSIDKLKGGIVGGSILSGILCVNDIIEIKPGITVKNFSGKMKSVSLKSIVKNLNAEKNKLKYAIPGGLIGIETTIDPTLTRADRLSGQVLGHKNFLPDVYIGIFVRYRLLKRLLGIIGKNYEVSPLNLDEIIMISTGSSSASCKILNKKNGIIQIGLTLPLCCEKLCKVTLSRRIEKHWRLIGWGEILNGKKI